MPAVCACCATCCLMLGLCFMTQSPPFLLARLLVLHVHMEHVGLRPWGKFASHTPQTTDSQAPGLCCFGLVSSKGDSFRVQGSKALEKMGWLCVCAMQAIHMADYHSNSFRRPGWGPSGLFQHIQPCSCIGKY